MITGFVMIVAYFIPYTVGWGEAVSIWFDLLAAIAFMFRLAARIFRVGTLMYGKRPGLREILRWART